MTDPTASSKREQIRETPCPDRLELIQIFMDAGVSVAPDLEALLRHRADREEE